jgi:uncharacterized protein YfiM (DUF2279 family)
MRGIWLVFSLGPMVHPGDRWFADDKLKHFFTSAFVQSMSYGVIRRTGVEHGPALVGASAVTAAVGVAKEVHDFRARGEFSVRDLSWDAAGAGAATVLLVQTRR